MFGGFSNNFSSRCVCPAIEASEEISLISQRGVCVMRRWQSHRKTCHIRRKTAQRFPRQKCNRTFRGRTGKVTWRMAGKARENQSKPGDKMQMIGVMALGKSAEPQTFVSSWHSWRSRAAAGNWQVALSSLSSVS